MEPQPPTIILYQWRVTPSETAYVHAVFTQVWLPASRSRPVLQLLEEQQTRLSRTNPDDPWVIELPSPMALLIYKVLSSIPLPWTNVNPIIHSLVAQMTQQDRLANRSPLTGVPNAEDSNTPL